ncbi:hypothetical protein GCM10022251_25350 [Phytohabitans flavus]|uniref:ESAT-6-like protein n=1 Tax=Phytohabitans flavus TaxID=1076124 RepID=A0A6F8XR90_9ACTN|nr:WXG100 family type VII secretion target [Phytohabitans flavus]BCB76261.1 hypothetical protein Pflav_026710 [Phytohabitans flavus]
MTAPGGITHGGGATNKAAIEVMDRKAVIAREGGRVEATMNQMREREWKDMAARDFEQTMIRWRSNLNRLLQTVQDVAELLQKYNKRLVAAQDQAKTQVAAVGKQVDGTAAANYSGQMSV